MTLFLIEITGGIIEIEAEDKASADAAFDELIAPLAERGSLSYRGPRTEAEYEAESEA